jgi:cell shape-determining protein MreD
VKSPSTRTLIVSAVYVFGFGLLESLLSNVVARPLFVPDFLLMLPLVIGIWYGRRYGFWLGLVSGFFRDFLAGRALGFGMLIGMYFGLSGGLITGLPRYLKWIWTCASTLIATILYLSSGALIDFLFPPLVDMSPPFVTVLAQLLRRLPLEWLSNAVATLFVLLVLFLLPLKKRPRRTELMHGGDAGVAHDVFTIR